MKQRVRSTSNLLVDYSKQRAETDGASAIEQFQGERLSKSLHNERARKPSEAKVQGKPVFKFARASSPKLAVAAKREEEPGLRRAQTVPTMPLTVTDHAPAQKRSSLQVHSQGSRQRHWLIDEDLLDMSVKTFDDEDSENETDSKGGIWMEDSSSEDGSESEEEDSEVGDEDSEAGENEGGIDIDDDISELSYDESLREISLFDSTGALKKDLQGESTASISASLTASMMSVPSLKEAGNSEPAAVQEEAQGKAPDRGLTGAQSVSFTMRRLSMGKRNPSTTEQDLEAVPSAIRLQKSLTQLLGGERKDEAPLLVASASPRRVSVLQGNQRSVSSRSLCGLLSQDTAPLSFKRSTSCHNLKVKPVSKRDPLVPLINAMALPRMVPNDAAKGGRRVALRRSSSESNVLKAAADSDLNKSSRNLMVHDGMNNSCSNLMTKGESLTTGSIHSSSRVRVMGNRSGRSVGSSRRLMRSSSGKSLSSVGSGRRLIRANSGKSLASNASGKSERRARRRLKKRQANEVEDLPTLTSTRSVSSLPLKAMEDDLSELRQNVKRSNSLRALVAHGNQHGRGDNAGNAAASASASIGKIMGLENVVKNERRTAGRRRANRRSSNDSVTSADTTKSELTALRDVLARANRLIADDSDAALFVTGSRIRTLQ